MMGLLAGGIAQMVGPRERRKMKVEPSSPPPPPPTIGSNNESCYDGSDSESDAPVESDENNNIINNDDDAIVMMDIGVTKKPYFHDKAAAIAASGLYYDHHFSEGGSGEDTHLDGKMEQVYLVGFDTLIRLLNPKYLTPSRSSLHALDPFFSMSRVRVTRRPGGDYGQGMDGGRELQDKYVRALAAGEREGEGGRREWAQRVQLVGRSGGNEETEEEMISSTKVREEMKRGNEKVIIRLVPEEVGRFILDQGLYRQDKD